MHPFARTSLLILVLCCVLWSVGPSPARAGGAADSRARGPAPASIRKAAVVPPPVPAGVAPVARRFRWPLDGRPTVTRRFDPPARPWLAGHRGVDLAGAPGQIVRAAGPGVVAFAGPVAGRGVVSVAHGDGLRTTYEPVLAGVSQGTAVEAGAALGQLAAGHQGCPVVARLHWGLRLGDDYLDPLALLGLARVRLLPRDRPPVVAAITPTADPARRRLNPLCLLAAGRSGGAGHRPALGGRVDDRRRSGATALRWARRSARWWGAGRQLVADWQAEHGAFIVEEIAAARAEMSAADAQALSAPGRAGA